MQFENMAWAQEKLLNVHGMDSTDFQPFHNGWDYIPNTFPTSSFNGNSIIDSAYLTSFIQQFNVVWRINHVKCLGKLFYQCLIASIIMH